MIDKMKEVSAITEKEEIVDISNFEPIKIQQNEFNYLLNIEVHEDKITSSINEKGKFPSIDYIRTKPLKEIKELNNIFLAINSFNDFYDYL